MSEGPLAFKSEIATATKCEAKDKDKGKAREAEDRSELQNSRKRDQHPISVEIPSKTDISTGRSANTAAVPVNPAHLVDDFEDVDSQLSGITGAAYNVDEPRTPSASRNDRPTVHTISNAETRQPPSLSTESFDLTNDWSGVSDFVSDSPSAPSSPSSVFARMQNLSAAPTFEAAACSARFPVWPSMAAHNVQPVSGNQPLYASLDPTIPHSGHARLPAYHPASVMYQDASVPLDRPPFNPFDEAAIQREMSRRKREAAIEARRRSTGNMFNPANASKNPFIGPSNHVGYPSSSLYQGPAPIRGYAGHQRTSPTKPILGLFIRLSEDIQVKTFHMRAGRWVGKCLCTHSCDTTDLEFYDDDNVESDRRSGLRLIPTRRVELFTTDELFETRRTELILSWKP